MRGRLAEIGTTIRPPLALSDDAAGPLLERAYSRDLTRKQGQRARDRQREPLRDKDGKVVYVTQRGHRVPVLKASRDEQKRHLQRQADFEASRANSVERQVRAEADKEFRVKGVKGRAAKELVTLAVRGTLRTAETFADDARVTRNRLMDEVEARTKGDPGYRHSGEAERARDTIRLLDKVIQDSRVRAQAKTIVSVAEKHARRLNEREVELDRHGLFGRTPGARRRAALVDYAVEHLGARHVTAEEHAKMERAARDVEVRAKGKLDNALRDSRGRRTPQVIAARAAYESARRDRISVSGREPEGVKRHEAAQDRLASARGAENAAKRRLEATVRARDRLTGAQASRRGRRAQEGDGSATAAERAKIAKARRAVAQAKRELREATSAARKAAEGVRKAPLPKQNAALRRGDGTFLSTKDIEDSLRSVGRDPESIAYLPYQGAGARAFHTQHRPGTRPVVDKQTGTRTGEQYRRGAIETSEDLLREHGIKQATQLAKAQQLDRLIANSGIAHPDGDKLWTWKEADELSERIDVDTRTGTPVFQMRNGQRLVPVRAYAARLSEDTRRIIEKDLQGPGAMESLHQRLLNDRVVHEGEVKGKGARNVVLVPAAEIERLERHLRPAGEIEKFFQLLNRPFRMAVLPQPRWLTGNIAEPYIVRLTAAGSGLNVFGLAADMRAASKALRSMERSGDPKMRQAAQEIRAQQFGGLFVGGGMARSVRRGLSDFPELEKRYGEMVAKLPATANAVEMLGTAGRFALAPLRFFFWFNRHIERGAQKAAFGRQFRRDLQEFTGSWSQTIRLQERAVADATKGLVNTPAQARFMRAQHELLGKYEGFNPRLRAWVQGPMPFLPWALNAARFVYWTMPVHHTALTALLVQMNDVVAKDWKEIHSNVPPGGLQFALPTEKGGWVDIARYTPWGLTTGDGGAVQTLREQVAPHFNSAIKALEGDDPFGRELQVDPSENAGVSETTDAQRRGAAGYSLLEALVPYLSTARRLREGGGTAFAGSTVLDPDVKPGTQRMSAARRTFDPFRPTYLSGSSANARLSGSSPDRATELLERRASVLAHDQARQDRLDDLLARRAELLSGP